MMMPTKYFVAVAILLIQILVANSTALDDYVFKADENYGWKDLGLDMTDKVVGRGYTGNIYFIYF